MTGGPFLMILTLGEIIDSLKNKKKVKERKMLISLAKINWEGRRYY